MSGRCDDIIEYFQALWKIANKLVRLFVENVEKNQFMGSIMETHVPFCWCMVIRILNHRGDQYFDYGLA